MKHSYCVGTASLLCAAMVIGLVPGPVSAIVVQKLTWEENPQGVMFGTYPREGGGSPAKVLEDLGMLPIQRVCWDHWSWIEISPGVYDWDVASFGILEEAHKYGAEAVGSIYMANSIPGFYAQSINDPTTRQAAYDFIGAFYQQMEQRLGQVYVVIDYEMQWYVFHNEAIDPDEWADWYVYLVGAARAAVPGCIVVCDVIADDHDYYLPGEWLTTAMSVSDALGIDDYGITPQIIHDDIQWFIDNYADGKPIHILENGFATWQGFSNKAHGTEEEQAVFFDTVIPDIVDSFGGVVKSYVQFMATDRGTGPDIEDHWGWVTYQYERDKPSLDVMRRLIEDYPAVVLESEVDVTEDLAEGTPVDLVFSEGVNYEGLRIHESINLSSVTLVTLVLDFVDEDGTSSYLVNVNGDWRYSCGPTCNITSQVRHGYNQIDVYFPQKRWPGTVTVSGASVEYQTVQSRVDENFEDYTSDPDLQAAWEPSALAINGLQSDGGENVLEGQQSMWVDYDLSGGSPYYGMVSYTYDVPQDWTGYEKLVIHYKGVEGNSIEKLRVRLLDSGGVAFLSGQKLSATGGTIWKAWEITLTGALMEDLADTRTVQLQVTPQQYGSGIVYFDKFELVVPPDVFPPTLYSAEIIGPRKMKVIFGEHVTATTANVVENYSVDGGSFSLNWAELAEDSVSVTLKSYDTFGQGLCYGLRVSGVEDLSGNPMVAGVGDSLPACYGDPAGGEEWSSVDDEAANALHTGISAVYPNPFNPSTRIEYVIGGREDHGPAKVRLAVFNVRGQRVRTLLDDPRVPGRYVALWNGADDHGHAVGPGVYFCRLEAAGVAVAERLVLIK